MASSATSSPQWGQLSASSQSFSPSLRGGACDDQGKQLTWEVPFQTRRDVCLRAKYECAKRTLSSWALSAGILVSLSKQQFADDVDSAVTPVKHQEQCGPCWTPTMTEYLVDCYWKSFGLERTTARELFTVDSGCNGTLTNIGFVFAAKNAICTEAYLQTASRL